MLVDIQKIGNLFGKGIVSEFGPSILKGALLKIFSLEKVDQKKVTFWVLENRNLWDGLGSEYQKALRNLASKL